MSKTSSAKFSFTEEISSHPAVEWISENKNIILWGFVGVIATLIFATQFIKWRMLSTEKDYFQAQALFTQFQSVANNPSENATADTDLAKLLTFMKDHPELKPKYEGPLAQTLLINNQIAQAQPLIDNIFKRTNPDHLQLYRDFTQSSLLIGQGKYVEAVEKSVQLKTALDQLKQEANPILYVFNLVRLATLFQQTDQIEEELKILNQLHDQPQFYEGLQTANQVYSIGKATLYQYLMDRRNLLSPDNG